MIDRFQLLRRRPRTGRGESGAVAIEYALIGAILGLGTLSALNSVRGSLNGSYSRIGGSVMLAAGHINRCDTASACLPVGTAYNIGFANNPASAGIFTSGFSNLEAGHIWSTGKNSTMTLDLGSLINGHPTSASLDLYTSAFVAQANASAVTTQVIVNGVSVGTITYDKGYQGGSKSVQLSNEALVAIAQNNGVAVVNFLSSASGRPVDYNYNTDQRDLGIAIGSLTVNPN
jgi:Flp pilus assembly pilin Flp